MNPFLYGQTASNLPNMVKNLPVNAVQGNLMMNKSDIKIFREPDGAHLALEGKFNPSTAMQLLRFMRAYHHQAASVHIHTEGVTAIDALGLSFFRQSLGALKDEYPRFVFTGMKASQLVDAWPENKRPANLSPSEEHTAAFYF